MRTWTKKIYTTIPSGNTNFWKWILETEQSNLEDNGIKNSHNFLKTMVIFN